MRGLRFSVASAVAMVMVIAGAVIVSAHGGDTSLIHGCVIKDTKYVRIVGANDKCKSNETAIDWSIQGIKGDAGPRGPGITEAYAKTLAAGSSAGAILEAIAGDPEGDFRLLLGIPQGAKGDQGPAGGLAGYEVVFEDRTIPPSTNHFGTVLCPAGKVVVGGGVSAPPPFVFTPTKLLASGPSFQNGEGWFWGVDNTDDEDTVVRVSAICVNA